MSQTVCRRFTFLTTALLAAIVGLSCSPKDKSDGGKSGSSSSDNRSSKKVLRHAVFFQFKESSTPEQIEEVVNAFRALPEKIDAIESFQWGTNNSPEKLDDGFTHCFLLSFKDEKGRDAYLPHEAHKAFGDVLRPHKERVFVIDYWGDPKQRPPEKELKHAVFFKFKDDATPEQIEAVEKSFRRAAAQDRLNHGF